MSKRQGLGKGLGALIPEKKQEQSEQSSKKIALNKIIPNRKQPRKNFDEDKINQLAQSIGEHGVIQPILLKKEEDKYVVIAGERRWRAAKLIGLKEVPAVVVEDIDDKEVLEISLIENIQREDLNPIEEAQAYSRLLDEFNLTQQELSKRIGKSRTAITNCMRLLNLDERVQDYLIDRIISEGHGRALLAIQNNEVQWQLAQKIVDEKLSVREVERFIKTLDNQKKEKNNDKGKNELVPYYKDIKYRLEDFFGTKVLLSAKNKDKGKIEIEYYSQEDLERILELLNISEE